MKKSVSISALISSLLASPLLAAAPVHAEDQTAAIVSPVDVTAELRGHLKALANGQPLNAYGMQRLQRQLARDMEGHLNRSLLLARNGITIPAQYDGNMARTLQPHMEKAAFLGIATSPATSALRDQLGLAHGMGLVVDYVDKDSPAAAAGIKTHDILQKLDDQLLINAQQLAVLVRRKNPGESVSLTLLRTGKTMTVPVKLVEKEVPVLEQMGDLMPGGAYTFPPALGDDFYPLPPSGSRGGSPAGARTQKLIDGQNEITITTQGDQKTLSIKDRQGHSIYEGPLAAVKDAHLPAEVMSKVYNLEKKTRAVTIRAGNSEISSDTVTLSSSDPEQQITMHVDKHGKSVTVKDSKTGQTLYDGPANTNEELKPLPPAVIEKVKAAGK